MESPAVTPSEEAGRGGSAVVCERVEATPPHGETVRVDLRRLAGSDPKTAVLVVHGFKGFKDWGFFPYVCERLAEAGHLVASFNFSRNGVGAGLLDFTDLEAFGRNTLSREMDDLHWMLDRLAAGALGGWRPVRTNLLGHSRGGGSCIVAAAERDDVAALATWAAVSTFRRWTAEQDADWNRAGVTYVHNARTDQQMPLYASLRDDFKRNARRLDVLAAAARVRVPWLVAHGADDATVPADEARALASVAGQAALEILPRTGHAFETSHPMGPPPPELKQAVALTTRHFAQAAPVR